MKSYLLQRLFPAAVIVAAVLAFVWWTSADPTNHFSENVPGMDNRPIITADADSVRIGEFFSSTGIVPEEVPGFWPRFRGINFDNINREDVKLADDWEEAGPTVLWSVALGEGHAAPVVANNRVYLLDYDEGKKADALRCFSLATGEELWRLWYEVHVKRNHGMSRTVPAVKDSYIVTIGPMCHVMCADAFTGEFLWGIDLVKEYGSKVPLWYTGQCPLIVDSLAIIAPAGDALMIGVHLETGQVIWRTPNPGNWQMSHSSIMPLEFQDRKMFVYCAKGGVVGVSAEPDDMGDILWNTSAWDHQVTAPSPLAVGKGRIFITGGYSAGSMMLQLVARGDSIDVDVLRTLTPKEGVSSEQQTAIFYDNHIFCILPKDAGPLKNQFVCCDPDDHSDILWSSGSAERFGLGPFILADGKFFVLSDDGVLTVLKATAEKYIPLTRAKILEGHDAWGPLALTNGLLLARDSKTLVCVDIRMN